MMKIRNGYNSFWFGWKNSMMLLSQQHRKRYKLLDKWKGVHQVKRSAMGDKTRVRGQVENIVCKMEDWINP